MMQPDTNNILTQSPLSPETEILDVLLADVNGILRGKRVPISHLKKLDPASGTAMVLPRGTIFLDSFGRASDSVDYGVPDGDPDRPLIQIDAPVPVPWEDRRAQVLVELADDTGQPWSMNPRRVLQQVVEQYRTKTLQPVIAIELEFYLLKADGKDLKAAQQNSLPGFTGPQTYNLDQVSDTQDFLHAVEHACKAQRLPITVVTSEYGSGQYEINLQHSADVLKACDQALLLKRVVRQIAMQQGLLASFMAKPFAEDSGNGMHVHVSLLDQQGNNVFESADNTLNTIFQNAIAGAIEMMPASIALFAQNTNSYKRFVPDSFVPVMADWGIDHRAVAIRVPYERGNNTRLEHRVAGADSNPCLTVAAVLAGILHGIENQPDLPEPTTGLKSSPDAVDLPLRFREAVCAFRSSELIARFFPDDFIRQYAALKYDEEARCHAHVDNTDYLRFIRTL